MTRHDADPHYHPALRPSHHRPSRASLIARWALIAVAFVVVGCVAWAGVRALIGSQDKPASPAEIGKVGVYFVASEKYERVSRPVYAGQTQVQAAIAGLLGGPSPEEAKTGLATHIPDGTKLESVKIDSGGSSGKERAVIAVSKTFLDATSRKPSDARIESESKMDQVAYTMAQFSNIKSSEVVAGGKTLKVPSIAQVEKPTKPEPVVKAVVAKKAIPAKAPAAGSGSSTTSKPASGPTAVPAGITQVQHRLVTLKYLAADEVTGKDDYATQMAVTAFQAWQGLPRDGSAGAATKAALATAQPPKPKAIAKTSGRYAQVYRDKGVTLLVENGQLVRAVHVSTGKTGYATPAGIYAVYQKELKHWSTEYNCWLPYASFFYEGYAFHEYPEIPAYPGSHGCCRVPAPEAPRVYEFLVMGTPVYVY